MIGFPQGMPPGGIAECRFRAVLQYRRSPAAIANVQVPLRPAILFLLTILFPIIPLSIFTIAGVAGGSAFWK